jgi:hypothetical protein
MDIDLRSKSLLSCMANGIIITYGDGHRWISFVSVNDNDPLDVTLRNAKIHVKYKIYGDIDDAFDYIDSLFDSLGRKSLIEQYDEYNDWW